MKSKVSKWGNSHGLRITSAMMAHLNIKAGEEIEMSLTSKGMEVIKNNKDAVEDLKTISKEVQDTLVGQTDPVKIVDDPYLASDVAYIVIDINPCAPLIREVPFGTKNTFTTLADAKEAARQLLQRSISETHKSLHELRQLGIENINYIKL